jgi:hypothetical protein
MSRLIPIYCWAWSKQDRFLIEWSQFTLTELDSSYAGIRAYFAHFDGRDEATMEVFKINYVFSYGDTDSIVSYKPQV